MNFLRTNILVALLALLCRPSVAAHQEKIHCIERICESPPCLDGEISTQDVTSSPSTTLPQEITESLLIITEESNENFDFVSLELTSDSELVETFDFTTTTTTEKWDEILKLTSKLHKTRVKVANFEHTIKEQQKIIAKFTETVDGLENDITKLKSTFQAEMSELKITNERCLKDFSSLTTQLNVAKKLYGLQKYSEKLKTKLGEFGVDVDDEGSDINSSRTSIKFSMFEIETDEFSGKIISNGQLFGLPSFGFLGNNVSELSSTNVGLVAIGRNSFEGMNQLKVLNLSYNLIDEIENCTFKSLVELKKLDLSQNWIKSIEIGAFEGMNDLQELNLRSNRLQKLPPDTFDSLLNLKVLTLSFNMLTELQKDTFTEINVIEEIYVDHNHISQIHPSFLSDFERSKIIDLRHNFCIDQRFPEQLTIPQLVIEVSQRCKKDNLSM